MNSSSLFKQIFQDLEHRLLIYKNSQISYYQYGHGPQKIICFHGYGEDGTLYEFLEESAGNRYSFYAPDLPYHGKTIWNEGPLFTQEDLSVIITMILAQSENSSGQPVMLLGFSLGGRMALQQYQAHSGATGKLILLAPDGLKVNFWYWLATQTKVGNRLFSYTMKNPGPFIGFLKLLNKLGWVNASVFKFVNFYIGNEKARQLLYHRWTAFRKIRPDIKMIKASVNEFKTPVRLVYGKYDRIILPARGEKFLSGIEAYCTLTIIDSGHQVVHARHANEILSLLPD